MRLTIITTLLMLALGAIGMAEPTMTLADVTRFDGSAIGYAGTASQNYDAYRAEVAKGEKAVPTFEKLLKEGTPAAKLYSALGLYSLNKARGMAALESLKGDKTPVDTMSGCMLDKTTVGEQATELWKDDGKVASFWVPRPKAGK